MVRIKICGITDFEDASAACLYGADAIGFVFAKSPRQVSPRQAKAIIRRLPPYVVTVGVFVNEEIGILKRIVRYCGLNCVQLHGDEAPQYCEGLKGKYKLIKAIRARDDRSLRVFGKFDVDAFLLDSYIKGARGGTGKKFNWNLAVRAKEYGKPVILSGGIGVDNVEDAVLKVNPYAIDVSSLIESGPGKKDHKLMRILIEKARKIN
ncbi:MAG: phosphoribosylanthranilate isomerase [Candidatus Omnitrophota bacterium]